jgi:hypothetical protein
MKPIHVHIPALLTPVEMGGNQQPRPLAALLQPKTNAIAFSTSDADDGEGKWVTINGAHVHIGKGGKIDKGPAELTGKSENDAHSHHHATQSKAHAAAAEAKGGGHADTKLHQQASRGHAMAAHHFRQSDEYAARGEMNAAKNNRRVAERHAAEAKTASDELAKRNPQQTEPKKQAPHEKPEAHKALHADAADDVKGSDKHEGEHKRLLHEYNKAGADWQRHAINNQISKNAEEATKHKAKNAHASAITASKHAHETDEPEHHAAAKEAIDRAIQAHQTAGTDSDGAKTKELEKLRKPHHAKTLKAKRDAEKAAEKAGAKTGKPEAKKAGPAFHGAEMERHHQAAEEASRKGNKEAARAHADAYRAHMDAVRSHGTGDYEERRKQAEAHSQRAAEAEKPKPKEPQGKPNVWGSNRKGSSGGGASPFGRMAARAAKKAAEEAADQDPKHKK